MEKELTGSIIGAFYYVYNQLGYGFLEKIYAEGLSRVLTKLGHAVEREKLIAIYLDGEVIGLQRFDMVVDSRVVVENKSTYRLSEADHRQVRSYVTSSEIQVGLLLHFGPEPKFHRFVSTRSPRHVVDSRDPQFPP